MSLKEKRMNNQKGRKKMKQSVLQKPRKQELCCCESEGAWALVGTTLSNAVRRQIRMWIGKLTTGEKIEILSELAGWGPGRKMK